MGETDFHFKKEQRNNLLYCWKSQRGRDIAVAYLADVELIVAIWLREQRLHPPTATKGQIAHANDLRQKAEALLASFEKLPQDVTGLLNAVWVRHKYGEAYFGMHEEACGKHEESSPASLSNRPPDFLQQTRITADFLRVTIRASQEMTDILRGSKLWHVKDAEKKLLYSLAVEYEKHFGKPPSAKNGSSFRKFVADLSKITGYTLGPNITSEVLSLLKENRQD